MKTLTVDDRHRVTLPEAERGQLFTYEPGIDGTIMLVPVMSKPAPKRVFAKLVEREGVMIFLGRCPRPAEYANGGVWQKQWRSWPWNIHEL